MTLIAAVEAGGTKLVLALANAQGEIIVREQIATRQPSETLHEMANWFAARQDEHGTISAFGIASFGPIDIDPASPGYGTITTTSKPGWSGTRYHDALDRFGAPIVVDTDVNGAAMGEFLAGAGQGAHSIAYTTVGTGIGTGIVNNGKPLSGISHYESGHIRISRSPHDDWPGMCPFHGACLEGLASGPAILQRWGHDLSAASPEKIGLVADYISELANNLVLLHMPEKLVFGGGVMKAPGLLAALREKTAVRLNGYIAHWDGDLSERIVAPALGDNAGIVGAIGLGQSALKGSLR